DIMLSISGAIEVGPDDHPVLCNVVEEMTIAAGLSKQPRIFIIPDEAPNAFATGTKPENSAVAVTAGLLGRLKRDELQGVIAHEMSHILNRDIMFMTMVGIMLGTIVMLSDVFLRGTFYGSMRGSRYSSRNDRNNGGGAAVMLIIAILMAIIAPLLAQLLYFATSRKREYLADASAVRLTRNPEGLADALEKIATNSRPMPHANRVTAPLYINNPNASRSLDSLTSTHPPIAKRIEILRKLAGTDGSYRSYDKVYNAVNGGSCVPGAALVDDMPAAPVGNVGRSAAVSNEPVSGVSPQRQTGDLIMALNDYKILTCTCGLKLKIPPRFRHKKAQCPKCGKVHTLA
ncbi:MAG: M48 family metallopeptidase, partial [Sedimentisphaerales bacterium]|nr:M48 family metallopeptidase [Sedimentisphaerales bacterium]